MATNMIIVMTITNTFVYFLSRVYRKEKKCFAKKWKVNGKNNLERSDMRNKLNNKLA